MAEHGDIRLACEGVITISSRIWVNREVRLEGAGGGVTLRGVGGDGLFRVATNAALTLVNLTVADTVSTNPGAVFLNLGRVTVQGCLFRGNTNRGLDATTRFPHTASAGSGGVIYQWSNGIFTAAHCVFRDNAAVGGNGLSSGSGGSTWGFQGQGGVGYFNGGSAAFDDCEFSGNSAVGGRGYELGSGAFGGALFFGAGSGGALTSCVFSNNLAQTQGSTIPTLSARAEGGAMWSTGQVQVAGCQFLTNRAVAATGGPAQGGAIHNEGDLRVAACGFRGNAAFGGAAGTGAASPVVSGGNAVGGALCTEGPARVWDTAFEGNTVTAGAGGRTSAGSPTAGGIAQGGACNAFGANATLLATNCGFVASVAQGGDGGQGYSSTANGGEGRGAAIFVDGPAALVNCTVALSTNLGGRSGTAWSGGEGGWARGALTFFGGTSTVAFCTLATNQVFPGAGASAGHAPAATLFNFSARVSLLGNILAGGLGSTNLAGTNLDLGYNLCSDDSLALTAASSRTNADPVLGPPAWNGGRSPTLALLPGSPALDAVPGALPELPPIDQRGGPRPQGAAADIGAFELGPARECSLGAVVSGAEWRVAVFGEAGHTYRLLGAAQISPAPVWIALSTNLAVSNGPVMVARTNDGSQRFYRAVSP